MLPLVVVTAGCGKYAEFSLPPLQPQPGAVQLTWAVRSQPVLGRGAAGDWDSVDTLNPSLVRIGERYMNFYSGFDGKTWRTGLATSPDGITWARNGKILSPEPASWEGSYIAANGAAARQNDMFFYWYQAGDPPQIGLARSPDGLHWNKHATPVISRGPRSSWDERGVADPYVITAGPYTYLFYLGQDRARRQRLGVARSRNGIQWEKFRGNPILELGEAGTFDEVGLGEPAVWQAQGSYWMLYTGRDRAENRRLGLARSQDGVAWTRVSRSAVLSGAHPWNSKVICDPHVEVAAGETRVWFGGGNQPRPDENLNGQIGFATLKIDIDRLAK
ncbi:MAG TPA: hypothetical protein VMZ52_09125 [Bryobacteraceae bacterium]|nr:hypothetical protein [Bryobacteraceae bacterium]